MSKKEQSEETKKPSFHILVCLIKIWTPKDVKNTAEEPEDALFLTEVSNIEITDSYKNLIGTASVSFPHGTIVKKTISQENQQEVSNNSALNASVEDTGVVITTRSNSKKAELGDFKVGNRIKIWLGYTTDPKVADQFKLTSKKSLHNDKNLRNKQIDNKSGCLNLMFNGYITKCSLDYPIRIHCENLASALKKITCPADKVYKNVTVNDFFSENGGKNYKLQLFKNTGLKLHSCTEKCEISVGDIGLNTHLTIADILTTWSKYNLYAFVKDDNGKPAIAIGRSYFSNAGDDSIVKYDPHSTPPQILFDYNVAENGLTLMNTDKAFLAVEATGLDKNEKFYHITIRRNPDWNESMSSKDKWQILNEVTISKKMQQMGATVLSKSKSSKHVDLSTYTIIPYMSKKLKITHEELLEEAIKYFESYNMNGIDGTLTLFGDLALKTGTKVELVDKLRPQKNGYYLVDEVHTTFGTNGYRQNIKLPYCISRIKPKENE